MSHEVDRSRWQEFRRFAFSGSVDASLVIGYTVVVAAVLYFTGVGGMLRTVLALPLVLFLPGYALVSLAFPGAAVRDRTPTPTERVVQLVESGVPGWYERLALSVAMTVTLLPLFALVLATTRWGFSTGAVLGSLAGFVVLAMFGALVRRADLPADDRFQVPRLSGSGGVTDGLFPTGSPLDGVLNVVVLLSVVLAMSALVYGLAAPQPSSATTEIQLLTEDDDGDLVAAGYPEAIPPGESAELTVGVTNEGDTESSYTVVVEAQHVEENGDDLEVLDDAELAELQLTAEPGDRATQSHTVSPPMEGENIRLNYYLYEGDVPDDPSADNADDHLWITVDGR